MTFLFVSAMSFLTLAASFAEAPRSEVLTTIAAQQ
jgi:hypothetical protein